MLSLAFILSLAAASPSLPLGTVVAGVSTHDGTHTDVTAFLPDGTSRVLFVEAHAAGFVPKGSLSDARVALALQHEGADGATVVVRSLDDEAVRTVVGERAIASQAPRMQEGHVTWVRAAEKPSRSTFDVIAAPIGGAGEEVRASIDGAWLSPLGDGHFVHITANGAHRVVALRGASLDVVRELGKGPMRLPAVASPHTGSAVVERGLGGGRAQLVAFIGPTLEHPRILRAGIAGMDPLVVTGGEGNVVAGAGTKRAMLTVIDSPGDAERRIDLGVAGVASPLAAAAVAGELVIVARIDRGRALPGETWIVDAKGPRALAKGGVIEVYGIVTSAPGGVR